MPSSSSVRITLMAISPRLATRTFSNIGGAEHNGLVKRAVVASFTALVTLAPAAPADAALRFKRSGAVPAGISLLARRLRAARPPGRGATFVRAGGPGQSATDACEGDGIGQL